MIYLIFWLVGLGTIWAGVRITEEVYRIALILTGSICLLWVLALSPLLVQLLSLILLLGRPRLSWKLLSPDSAWISS